MKYKEDSCNTILFCPDGICVESKPFSLMVTGWVISLVMTFQTRNNHRLILHWADFDEFVQRAISEPDSLLILVSGLG